MAPPRTGRIHGSIAHDLGVAIVGGRLLPGALLRGEIEHSEDLQVSRSAYREAIRILAAKGLVESRPKAGTRVCARRRWNMLDPDILSWTFEAGASPAFLRDLFELRMVVEPAAAGHAANRRDSRDLTRMGHALEEMARAPTGSAAWGAADSDFHDAILVTSRNEILMSLASSIEAALTWMTAYRKHNRGLRDLEPEHRAVYDAIVAGDAGQARAAMVALLHHARAQVEASLVD